MCQGVETMVIKGLGDSDTLVQVDRIFSIVVVMVYFFIFCYELLLGWYKHMQESMEAPTTKEQLENQQVGVFKEQERQIQHPEGVGDRNGDGKVYEKVY